MKTIVTRPEPQPSEETSFRLYLRAELARRCARNAKYSLRSFARQLGVDHSTLSQILRGRRALTPAVIGKLGSRLGLDERRLQAYRAGAREIVVYLTGAPRGAGDEAGALRGGRRVPGRRGALLGGSNASRGGAGASGGGSRAARSVSISGEARRLTQDAASVMADWYHFAILELIRLKCFRPDSRWIARVLDIGVDDVNMALQRLLRLGLLEMTARGKWVDRSGPATASLADFTHAAVQRLFEQVRRLEHDAVGRLPSGRAEWSATTLAVNTARLPEAAARLARFRSEMVALLEQDAERNDVYRLDLGLFPVTRIGGDGTPD